MQPDFINNGAFLNMGQFTNCVSTNNGGGGFVTTNLFSTFDNCTADGNNGPGFLDLSGEPVEKLLSMFPVIQERAQMLKAGPRQDETIALLTAIEKSIRSKNAEAGFLEKSFAKLRELTIDWSTEEAAKLIFLFATQSPKIIDLLHKAGILLNVAK
ncbi:hypothetical protein [Hymenobacter sp. PAMC 26628]|uniref:hypothetical protein n=1 Tax=Hymenobacter sp. PAMC 26628 TaxID=1484118 RepID=UPI0012FF810F|nr:hypothetical protein [Hymenobacter sp. PAMC 26628]